MEHGSDTQLNPQVVVTAIFSAIKYLPVWVNRNYADDAGRGIHIAIDILVNGLAEQYYAFVDVDFPASNNHSLDNSDRA